MIREKKLPCSARARWARKSPRISQRANSDSSARIVPRDDVSEAHRQGRLRTRLRTIATALPAPVSKPQRNQSPRVLHCDLASLVTVGNFEDDLAKLKDCDLIIEAVVENLDIKRSFTERSNNIDGGFQSSLPTPAGFRSNNFAEGRSEDFPRTFLACTFLIRPVTCTWSS